MKVAANTPAPDFSITDINGEAIKLSSLRGRKVHLAFYRFSGCPFCNLRFHEIEKLSALYKENNVVLISIYESSAENMKSQIADEKFYSKMIPDPTSSLYELYDLDRSVWGLVKFLLFGGGISQALQGEKLFRQKVKHDGHTDRIEAEFLIDKDGKVAHAYYGKTPGDNLPIDVIKKFVTA